MFKLIAKILLRNQLIRVLRSFTTLINWPEIQQIKPIVKEIDGCPDSHGILLYTLAQSGFGTGAVVEIGSWKGKSTIWLAKGSKSAGREKVFAIDPHTGSLEHRREFGNRINTESVFRRNIERARVQDWVIPLVMTSSDAAVGWKKPVRLLWIDGSHEYEDVKKDFVLWEPHLVYGGTIALHDCFDPRFTGPRRIVKEFLLNSNRFSLLGFIGGLVFAKKVEKLSRAEKLSNFVTSTFILMIDFAIEHTPSKIVGLISKIIFY